MCTEAEWTVYKSIPTLWLCKAKGIAGGAAIPRQLNSIKHLYMMLPIVMYLTCLIAMLSETYLGC